MTSKEGVGAALEGVAHEPARRAGGSSSTSPIATADSRSLRWLFVAASFLGSSLLFLVQPMVARLLLPIAGGSSALWNTSMVFFQLMLLAAYLFVHVAAKHLQPRMHGSVQVTLFLLPLLLVLPVRVPDGWVLDSSVDVSVWALGTLFVIVGLPFFAISTASPTLQRWYSLTRQADADDPYFLYAAGNVGSVLALVAYPIAVEPLFTLRQQGLLWTVLYGFFVAMAAAAAFAVRSFPPDQTIADSGESASSIAEVDRRALWTQRVTWVGWAAVPSALLLGVTSYITTDLASFPLLWIIPLLGYLTSYVLTFSGNAQKWVARCKPIVLLGLMPLALSIYFGVRFLALSILVQLSWFFAAAVVCHGRLAADRPPARRLTEFYLSVSVGGAMGGLLTVLVAPLVFTTVMEYPIAIALVLLIVPLPERRAQLLRLPIPRLAVPALLLASAASALFWPTTFMLVIILTSLAALANLTLQQSLAITMGGLLLFPAVIVRVDNLYTDRTAFGVYGVADRDGFRVLAVGTTNHGTQDLSALDAPTATSYYHPHGPLGDVFALKPPNASVGVVGLGAGGLAAYGDPGDRFHFYEIDPAVVEIAQDDSLFTYLRETDAAIEIEVVDGRLGVNRSDAKFDILVLDAFSSDAVPVHLLTLEAVSGYSEHLSAEGILVFNISNRHFDLEPVLGRVALELDLRASHRLFLPPAADVEQGATASRYLVMAPTDAVLESLTSLNSDWIPADGTGDLWTDDYSFVLGALDF